MTAGPMSRPTPGERLLFVARTVVAEVDLLRITDARLFALPMDAERAASLRADVDLAERVDAFVARFGRLQDTAGDKLLPAVLAWMAEPVGPAIDNLARAERLGWIESATDWLRWRQLRNFMIHEYVDDARQLAEALTKGHEAVDALCKAGHGLTALVLGEAADSTPQPAAT